MTPTKKDCDLGSPHNKHLQEPVYKVSLNEAIADYLDHLYEVGYGRPSCFTASSIGVLQRFRCPNDKRRTANCWGILFDNPYCGIYGSWKEGEKHIWMPKKASSLTNEDRQALAKQIEQTKRKREKERERLYRENEKRALNIWNRSRYPDKNHPYLVAKAMPPDGLRQLRESLVVPLYQGGRITSLQFIDTKGKKKFLSGGRIQGSAFIYGDLHKPFKRAFIAESPSTGYSVHVLGNYAPTFCAMSAGNLERVACAVRKKWPDTEIIIAADNDINPDSEKNPGIEFAERAAIACGGKVSVPQSLDGMKIDWCDLRLLALRGAKS